MRRTFCIIIAAGIAAFSSQSVLAATKVFLLGGQSNMGGNGVAAELPSPFSAPQTAVKFWNSNSTDWVALRGGFGNSSASFGPEVTFGYTLHNLFPNDDIYLVKYGITSTSLAVQWKPDGTGAAYNTFKTTANAAIQNLVKNGKSPVIAGMIWMQGEEDSYTEATASAYHANLKSFITTVRSDFDTAKMRFVIGRILTTTGPAEYNALVQESQMTVPNEVGCASWFSTDDLQIGNVGHYGTQGQIDLGIRFANEFTVVPEPSSSMLLGVTVSSYCLWKRWHRKRLLGCRRMHWCAQN
jgi:hypothetical protein